MSKRNRSSQSIVRKVGTLKPDVVATAIRVVARNGKAGVEGFVSEFFPKRVWSFKAKRKAFRRGRGILQKIANAGLIRTMSSLRLAVTKDGADYVKAYDAAAAVFGVRAIRRIVSVYMNDNGVVKHRRRTRRKARRGAEESPKPFRRTKRGKNRRPR